MLLINIIVSGLCTAAVSFDGIYIYMYVCMYMNMDIGGPIIDTEKLEYSDKNLS